MRLAVGEPARNGSADTGRDHRVDDVEIEADVDERRSGEERERVAHRPLEAASVDVAHRVDADVELTDQLTLAVVERADADECGALDRRRRPCIVQERIARGAECCGERHPMDVARRRRLWTVEVAVCVDPEHRAGAVRTRETTERADRDRVVAAEDERQVAALACFRDERRDAPARALDRLEVARPRVADLGRLREAGTDVAPVDADTAELLDSLLEPRVPDRRGAHVAPAPAGPQIEAGADHCDGQERLLCSHFGKATSTWTRARSTSCWRTTMKASLHLSASSSTASRSCASWQWRGTGSRRSSVQRNTTLTQLSSISTCRFSTARPRSRGWVRITEHCA